ncbi:hypothetical protein NEIELOOT_01510 [Neisseria elongata subsp. glycolytica ATCC 29315]|uniref:Uncharacterized protein n=1 Tax=Neisseria elongata subsp. glycolytica ATCC 29315 TaxID=546263 RepID=D4DR17_NEIEG|nr:hypothetical protein NEIELOOT_01510 [Neisseria elongata subsp. glycolytica ATCC 29315]
MVGGWKRPSENFVVGFQTAFRVNYSVAFSIFSPTWVMPRPTALPPSFTASFVRLMLWEVSSLTPLQVLEQAAKASAAVRISSFFIIVSFV